MKSCRLLLIFTLLFLQTDIIANELGIKQDFYSSNSFKTIMGTWEVKKPRKGKEPVTLVDYGYIAGCVTALSGYGLCSLFVGDDHSDQDLEALSAALIIGYTLGCAGGIYFSGKSLGSNGSFFITLLGGGIGMSIFYKGFVESKGLTKLLVTPFAIATITMGSTLGYVLTNHDDYWSLATIDSKGFSTGIPAFGLIKERDWFNHQYSRITTRVLTIKF